LQPFLATALTALDWVVVAGYLVLVMGAGLLARRRASGSLEAFFLSGRQLPWWLAGTSMVATSFASDTPLVITGWTRADGVAGNWRWWGYLVSVLLIVVLFARLWQRSGVLTDVEYMELRYSGRPARFLRGFKSLYQVVFMHCFVMGWVMLGMTKVMSAVLHLDASDSVVLGPLQLSPALLTMIGCCVLALVYSEITGLWGVVLTDFVQFLFAMTGAIVLMVVVVQDFGGMLPLVDALRAAPAAAGKLAVTPHAPGAVWTDPSSWNRELWQFVVYVGVIWIATKNSDGSGVMSQRVLACKSERHAIGATLWYAIAHNAVRPWPWILVALASLIVLPPVSVSSPVHGRVLAVLPAAASGDEQADAAHAPGGRVGSVVVQSDDGIAHHVEVPDSGAADWAAQVHVKAGDEVQQGQLLAATDDEAAYPAMMLRYLGSGLMGLMVASFLAAFMSTVDTHVNTASSYLVNDFYKRFLRPAATEAHYVRVARICGPLVMLVALAFGMGSDSVRGMFDVFSSLFSGVGVIYLLRWLWWRINAWSEIVSLIVGALVTGAVGLWPQAAARLLPAALVESGQPVFPGPLLLVVAVTLPVTVLATLLTPAEPHGHLQAFYDRVRPLGAWGPLRPAAERGQLVTLLRVLLAWVGSTAFVVAAILLPGDLLLEGGAHAKTWLVVGALGLLGLFLRPSRLSRHARGKP